MPENELQRQLFTRLRENLPPHLSVVDELCELLGLGTDSVYRRMRGETPLTLLELKKICEAYRLSIDQLLELKSESVLFDAPGLTRQAGEFSEYMQGLLTQFRYFNSFSQREMFYLCKDSTIWNFYLFPGIAAFKTFFWSKTINNQPDLRSKLFSLKEFPYTECFQLGQQVLEEFNQIPCVEIWNLESLHSTINQIAYYREAGQFLSRDDFEAVIDSFIQMIHHLELQAEKGYKFMPGASEVAYRAPIRFYVNELILGNNTMILQLDNQRLTMVTHSVFHYLFTRDTRFAGRVMDSFETLLSRSTLISQTGEKDRNRFFNAVRQKVEGLRKLA